MPPRTPPPPRVEVERVRHADAWTRVTRLPSRDAPGGRPFVLVAGIGVASTYFEFLAPVLAARGDVYALDLPGFAGVPRSAEQPTIAFFADHVGQVLDHYGLHDAVLVGHSMGTQVVVEVLTRRPGLTQAVLISPVVDDLEPSAPAQAVRFVVSAAHETPHLAVTALTAYLLCGAVYLATVLPHLLRYPMVERVAEVRAATLLIRGEHDRTSPRRFQNRLAARMADARSWEIRGAAHSVLNAHAVGVADLVVRHVDGDLPRRGRVESAQAAVPAPPRSDPRLLLDAATSRARGWFAALVGDDAGVQRAKGAHALTLWRAYFRS